MPPRKRARVSQAASPMQKSPEPPSKPTDEDILNDPWTDEEETGLFKGLIKWKPTGIHKHFRMLQLRDYLLENNYILPRSAHTQIPGIWQKLESLYDLEALDQREDARQLSDLSDDEEEDDEEASDDVYSLAANKIHSQSFELPEQEYGEQLWKQRFPQDERDESPLAIPGLNVTAQAPVKFTPSFSIEPEEPTAKSRPRGRPSKAATKAKPAASRRSKRQAESVATGSEEPRSDADEAGEEDGSEEGTSEAEEDDEQDEEEDEEASQTSAPATRGRARGRGRVASRGRPRGRRR